MKEKDKWYRKSTTTVVIINEKYIVGRMVCWLIKLYMQMHELIRNDTNVKPATALKILKWNRYSVSVEHKFCIYLNLLGVGGFLCIVWSSCVAEGGFCRLDYTIKNHFKKLDRHY